MDRSVALSIGDSYHLRTGKDHIVYADMPSEKYILLCKEKGDFRTRDLLGICSSPKSKVKLS